MYCSRAPSRPRERVLGVSWHSCARSSSVRESRGWGGSIRFRRVVSGRFGSPGSCRLGACGPKRIGTSIVARRFRSGNPVPLRRSLTRHEVHTVFELGWSTLSNGDLLDASETAGFEVFVTADSNLKFQQNLDSRRIALVVLSTPSWPRIRRCLSEVVSAVDLATAGSYKEVNVPWADSE